MPIARLRRALACACGAAAALGAGASAAASPPPPPSDTTIAVSPRVTLSAPAVSPVDFPGVKAVRRGRPLPGTWVVVSRDVRITRGSEAAFAALRMTCPSAKTWRSGASSGQIGAGVLDRNARASKRSVLVMGTFSTSAIAVGATATGTVLALCR